MCKKIHRGGNAEQYNADKKYKEAVAEAVEECADDTKGQTCYICTQALHWKTKEGLVRGCACRGTAGFAHVSCLAEQAKILIAEAEENNLDYKAFNLRWPRWWKCSLCEQEYHGVVRCALAWACWKMYVGRPEVDETRQLAISVLGNGLFAAKHDEDALIVQEAELSMRRRLNAPEGNILIVQTCLANSHLRLGRNEQASNMLRDIYSGRVRLNGEESRDTIIAALNYTSSLGVLRRVEEAKSLLRKTVPVAQRVCGENDEITLRVKLTYAMALYRDTGASLDDLRESVTRLEDLERVTRRVLGGAHPITTGVELRLQESRAALRRKTPSPGSA
ncbi:unnamed protein product [Pelagomonas calceolata]|uniref:RING-CH-type domain-containing protein n=1 Tax=Pelagomonas calceolata TaxID=35677 RepID=A0A8J2S9C4_9STRA|nr:unnamed protein product [Pelagomonas calceolata]